ncbi:sensor histidine kinase [Chitinophaga pinensis]|uniref:histidine kinase n=1 Tax=Chitinophaga pinensis (strain ATCC 43595 / DSM 2588 / LMG 13176 / NBRC 15968 / NCIMB 11800 / UQM 2034) TaxID=485918 RepID=A0A979G3M2_CHIPD|nr:HAMP domain-containing sensor histidine kinase [Chitinophaga pinensis]ACU60220.1 histidine kinase [Chitinophaga pinensis DSM 2588]
MKWLSAKYAYPLVVISVLVSIVLQIAWLRQLFTEQRAHVRDQIEQIVNNSAKEVSYESAKYLGLKDTIYRRFLLSPEWIQLRQGFDGLGAPNMYKAFDMSDDSKDTTYIIFKFVFFRPGSESSKRRKSGRYYSSPEIPGLDSMILRMMDSTVRVRLQQIGLNSKFHIILSDLGDKIGVARDPDDPGYISDLYTYNLEYRRRCQIQVESITGYVWYEMRYYVLSSLLMIVLTCAAFYFIIRLMRNQRLYAEARVAFTSNMTHELKTPIATVALALESITRYDLVQQPQKLEEYLSIGRQELQRLNLMIEKVLNLSREQDVDYPLNRVLYDVQTGLQDVVRSMELQLANAGAVCKLELSPEPCFVYGDPVHLTNVCYNLIENAIKYAIAPLLLEISCAVVHDRVVVHFKDNGPGIDKIYHDKIFDRFFRVPVKGDIHDVKGSGLGLNYVRSIVTRLNGTITVKSEPGKGSDFMISLPAAT